MTQVSIWAAAILAGIAAATASATEMEWVQISGNGKGFTLADSGRPFVPWGFNYDHEHNGDLLEDYWDNNWDTVASAFSEMKLLQANTVRIHLQLGKFMQSPAQPNQSSLLQLTRMLRLLPQTGYPSLVRQTGGTTALENSGRVLGSHCADMFRKSGGILL